MTLVRDEAKAESAQAKQYVGECIRRAGATGISVVEYRLVTRRISDRKGSYKRLGFLMPRDAYRLYNSLHYSPVLVCSLVAGFVSRDPGREEPKASAILSVEAFVRHKAVHRLVRAEGDAQAALERFAQWWTADS